MKISQELMAYQTFKAFPKLEQTADEIYFIDASINQREVFLIRDTDEIVNEIHQALIQGKTKFFFYMFGEAMLSYIVFKVHRIAKLLNDVIPPENFFYLSGAINGEEAYDKIATRYNFPFRISVLSAAMCYFYLKNSLNKYDIDYGTFEINTKPKKFLCFNKLPREQRIRLMERMLEKRYTDLGYYSFEFSDSGDLSAFIDRLDPITFSNIRANKQMFPLRLNINENRKNPTDIIPDDLQYFKNSYFSIVNETLYYGYASSSSRPLFHQLNAEYSSVFISEKTFKCLAVKHPFIIFGRPGTIKGLLQMGFKTFSPFFDESYDDIEDDDARFDAIFNEITRLVNLSDDEWLNILRNIEPIVEHNYHSFFNRTHYSI